MTDTTLTAAAPGRFSMRGVALRLFFTCWLVYALHFATNTVREIYPALSLGDHLSFDVSEYLGLHPDIFEIPGRGAFIDNNPGASILGAIPYALARPIVDRIVERVQRARAASGEPPPDYNTIYPLAQEFYRKAYERGLDVKFGLAAGVMQAFLMAPLSALSAVVMFYILASLTSSIRTGLLLALLYAFATPVFFRTGQLNQNVLIGHCALFAFALLWRPWDDPARSRRPRYLLAGLLCGWAVVLDYSGLVVVLVLGLYALARTASLPAAPQSPLANRQDTTPQRSAGQATPGLHVRFSSWLRGFAALWLRARSRGDILRFAAGVAAGLAVLLGYQWLAFGSPFLPAQRYMPPTVYSRYGYHGLDWPHLDLLWQTAFGMRFGLFTSAPLLLLALYVPGWFRGRARLVASRETWCILLFSAAFFLFAAANQFGWLQFNSGVRHVVPVTPFLFLLAAGVLLRLPPVLAVLAGIGATYWSWSLAMYRDVEQGLGVFESLIHITREGFRLPWLTTLERLGYLPAGASAVPLLAVSAVIIWALWSVCAPRDRTQTPPPAPAAGG